MVPQYSRQIRDGMPDIAALERQYNLPVGHCQAMDATHPRPRPPEFVKPPPGQCLSASVWSAGRGRRPGGRTRSPSGGRSPGRSAAAFALDAGRYPSGAFCSASPDRRPRDTIVRSRGHRLSNRSGDADIAGGRTGGGPVRCGHTSNSVHRHRTAAAGGRRPRKHTPAWPHRQGRSMR